MRLEPPLVFGLDDSRGTRESRVDLAGRDRDSRFTTGV